MNPASHQSSAVFVVDISLRVSYASKRRLPQTHIGTRPLKLLDTPQAYCGAVLLLLMFFIGWRVESETPHQTRASLQWRQAGRLT